MYIFIYIYYIWGMEGFLIVSWMRGLVEPAGDPKKAQPPSRSTMIHVRSTIRERVILRIVGKPLTQIRSKHPIYGLFTLNR